MTGCGRRRSPWDPAPSRKASRFLRRLRKGPRGAPGSRRTIRLVFLEFPWCPRARTSGEPYGPRGAVSSGTVRIYRVLFDRGNGVVSRRTAGSPPVAPRLSPKSEPWRIRALKVTPSPRFRRIPQGVPREPGPVLLLLDAGGKVRGGGSATRPDCPGTLLGDQESILALSPRSPGT